MSAAATARRVLDWSLAPDGSPPGGDLEGLAALLAPGDELRRALARAGQVAIARLGLGPADTLPGPPLGSATLVLAAAIGAALHPAAADLANLCPPPRGGPALALHHALVAPALAYLPPARRENLVLRSPLTAVLHIPPGGGEDAALSLAEDLIATRSGRRLLAQCLAEPSTDARCLDWRGRLLATLRLAPDLVPFVLDVYEAAVALHAPDWLRLTHGAMGILGSPGPDSKTLATALAVGRWWEPFLALYRADHEAIRARRYLNDFDLYLAGIRLAQAVIHLRQGVA
jgi:hypothetical protein